MMISVKLEKKNQNISFFNRKKKPKKKRRIQSSGTNHIFIFLGCFNFFFGLQGEPCATLDIWCYTPPLMLKGAPFFSSDLRELSPACRDIFVKYLKKYYPEKQPKVSNFISISSKKIKLRLPSQISLVTV